MVSNPWRSIRAGLVGLIVGAALLPFPVIGVLGMVGLLLGIGQLMSGEVRSRDPSRSPRHAAGGLVLLTIGGALLAGSAVGGVFLVHRAFAPESLRVAPVAIRFWLLWLVTMLLATAALVEGLRLRAGVKARPAWIWGVTFFLVGPAAALLTLAILAIAPTDL